MPLDPSDSNNIEGGTTATEPLPPPRRTHRDVAPLRPRSEDVTSADGAGIVWDGVTSKNLSAAALAARRRALGGSRRTQIQSALAQMDELSNHMRELLDLESDAEAEDGVVSELDSTSDVMNCLGLSGNAY